MERRDDSNLPDLPDSLTCPICFEPYDERPHRPLMICPNGHSICEACLGSITLSSCPIGRCTPLLEPPVVNRGLLSAALEFSTVLSLLQRSNVREVLSPSSSAPVDPFSRSPRPPPPSSSSSLSKKRKRLSTRISLHRSSPSPSSVFSSSEESVPPSPPRPIIISPPADDPPPPRRRQRGTLAQRMRELRDQKRLTEPSSADSTTSPTASSSASSTNQPPHFAGVRFRMKPILRIPDEVQDRRNPEPTLAERMAALSSPSSDSRPSRPSYRGSLYTSRHSYARELAQHPELAMRRDDRLRREKAERDERQRILALHRGSVRRRIENAGGSNWIRNRRVDDMGRPIPELREEEDDDGDDPVVVEGAGRLRQQQHNRHRGSLLARMQKVVLNVPMTEEEERPLGAEIEDAERREREREEVWRRRKKRRGSLKDRLLKCNGPLVRISPVVEEQEEEEQGEREESVDDVSSSWRERKRRRGSLRDRLKAFRLQQRESEE